MSRRSTLKQHAAHTGRTLELDGVAWRRLRERILRRDGGLCYLCRKPARIVHHKDHSHDNNAESNLVACCTSCHSIITMMERYGRVACDEDGFPLTEEDQRWKAENSSI